MGIVFVARPRRLALRFTVPLNGDRDALSDPPGILERARRDGVGLNAQTVPLRQKLARTWQHSPVAVRLRALASRGVAVRRVVPGDRVFSVRQALRAREAYSKLA